MIRRHLTYANVVSTIALFCVLGGGAYAVSKNSVGSRQIKDDSVRSKDVKNRSIKGVDIADDTITSRQIEEGRFDMTRFLAMRSGSAACDPTGPSPTPCAQTVLNPREPSQVLLVGGGTQRSGGTAGSAGFCQFRADGLTDPSITDPVVVKTEGEGSNGFSISAVTSIVSPVPPGERTFRLVCSETEGDVRFDTYISALALGGTP